MSQGLAMSGSLASSRSAQAVQAAADERIIFLPETSAFGGGERVLLSLSQFLHERQMAHRFAWYFKTVTLAEHAHWPIREEYLEPARQPWAKIRALNGLLGRAGRGDSARFLLVGIQAALHAGLCPAAGGYSMLIFDTPSLLSPPPGGAGARMLRQLRLLASRPIIARAMRRARVVIANSDYMAREMKELYGHTATVVRLGAKQGEFSRRQAGSREPFRLLSVCRLEASKRVDWMIQALGELKDAASGASPVAGPGFELHIAGAGGALENLRTLAGELGVAGQVHFHGRVSESALEELYRTAHLFLMPARQGYGLPALESLSRGLPVVVHRQSGVSEILRATPWVELIDGPVSALAAAIRVMAERVRGGVLAETPLPPFPSEEDSAREIFGACGWL